MEFRNTPRLYPSITANNHFRYPEMDPMEPLPYTKEEIKKYLDELKKEVERSQRLQIEEIEELSKKPHEVCLLIESKKSPSAFRKVLSDGFIDDLVEKYRPKYDGTETVQDWTNKTSEFLLQMGRKIDCLEILMEENELELFD